MRRSSMSPRSFLLLVPIAALVEGRGFPAEHRRAHSWLGVLNPGVSYALGLAGLARITASASALLWATEPILILLIATPVLGAIFRPVQIAVFRLIFGGV